MIRQLFRVFLLTIVVCFSAHALDGGIESLRQSGKAFSTVAKSVSPSVVFIQVEGSTSTQQQGSIPFPFEDDFFKRFFGESFPGFPPRQELPQEQYRSVSQGSGFVFKVKDGLLSDKTYIMTNNHVVEGADKVHVKFKDGQEYEAKITGRDPQSDIAVIEIRHRQNTRIAAG